MLLAGAAVAAATWQRAGIVELHEPGDGGSAGLFGAAHGAELGGIFWYWPSAGEAPNWRYWAVFFGIGLLRARPRIGGMGGMFWYWPVPGGARKGRYWAAFFGIGLSGFADFRE